MKRFLSVQLVVCAMLFITSPNLSAQGVTRSTGLGMRLSYWNIGGQSTRIRVSDNLGQSMVDISGAGVWLYFSSRAYHNWFFELSLGAVGGVKAKEVNFTQTDVNVEAIIPFLLGIRYDILATRLPGAFHPYVSGGGGPYWATSIEAKNRITEKEETIVSDMEYGGYLGGGMNIVLASWFALNMDMKYHFVDFQTDKDYSGLEFGMGFSFMWGSKREIFQIKETKLIVKDIYPAYYQFYNTYPLALVTVNSLVGYPIEVNIRSSIQGFSERVKDSGFVRIEGGETKDIPVTVFFSRQFQEVRRSRMAILDLDLEVRATTIHRREISTQLTIHSRNAWDGDISKLSFFITPDDENILQLSREMMNEIPSFDRTSAGSFGIAWYTFNYLKEMGIRYNSDPNIPFYQDDRVQYAMETLDIGSGDCDDLVVLYASLLESMGIATAFVEVRDPEKELAHLYLLFRTGLDPAQGSVISSNDKRYIVRENEKGQSSIWIPVETTLIEEGFEAAWEAGAMQYLQEGIYRNGLAEGWVRIID